MPEFDTIEITIDDKVYIVEGEYEGGWVDNGIGGYEYWGARGTHHDWCYEIESYSYLVYDNEGDDITEQLPDGIRSAIDSRVSDVLNRRVQDDPPDKDDGPDEPDDPPEPDYD